jgi:hypothetical protein
MKTPANDTAFTDCVAISSRCASTCYHIPSTIIAYALPQCNFSLMYVDCHRDETDMYIDLNSPQRFQYSTLFLHLNEVLSLLRLQSLR